MAFANDVNFRDAERACKEKFSDKFLILRLRWSKAVLWLLWETSAKFALNGIYFQAYLPSIANY